MVKYLALTRVEPCRRSGQVGCPGGALGNFGAFGTIHETVRFFKSMVTFRNVDFSKVCMVF